MSDSKKIGQACSGPVAGKRACAEIVFDKETNMMSAIGWIDNGVKTNPIRPWKRWTKIDSTTLVGTNLGPGCGDGVKLTVDKGVEPPVSERIVSAQTPYCSPGLCSTVSAEVSGQYQSDKDGQWYELKATSKDVFVTQDGGIEI